MKSHYIYKITNTVNGKITGRPCSEVCKRMASKTHKGKIVSKETRSKMRISTIKRFATAPASEETRQKLRDAKNNSECVRGDNHPTAKLRESDVILIRKLASEGETCTALAKQFGVWPTAISKVVLRQRWAHVP